ncbi:MAG: hypothetical protein WBO23_16880 [Burkholderiales bacterium]
MRNLSRTRVFLSATLMAALLAACTDERSKNGKGAEILLDKDAPPALHTLVRVQEQPAFPVDEGKKPYAVIGDREERAPTSDKPRSLDESKPKK